MRSTTIAELRRDLAAWLRRVERGERVLVKRRGEIVAELRPAPGGVATDGAPAAVEQPPVPLAAEARPEADLARADEEARAPRRGPAEVELRLALFDMATARQRERDRASPVEARAERDWTREDLYDRGRPR